MGSMYVSLSVRADATGAFAAVLQSANDTGFAGPLEGGWMTCVSERLDMQEQRIINDYAGRLSQDVNAPVLSVLNHDDAVLSVDLFEAGEMVAAYNSVPAYFAEAPSEEDLAPRWRGAEHLAGLKAGVTVAEVERVLGGTHVFAQEGHQALISLLGLPLSSLGMGHAYVLNGESPVPWQKLP